MNPARSLIERHRDVLDARPSDGEVPDALATRGWDAFLLALSDDALEELETRGLDSDWPGGTPPTLRAMIDEARAVCALPSFSTTATSKPKKLETPRKRAQIDAFAELVVPLASRAARVLDVGSGHGHLTREIAEKIDRPVVGLERDPALIARARSLSESVSFAVTDVLHDGLQLSSDDCVIGLHACGELGDAMVEAAARTGASIALVGCCLQKRRTTRASFDASIELPKRLLGLSNLTARDVGVEATRAENLLARERRLALHRLLGEYGPLRHGAEMDGLNRRAAHDDLPSLVARVFSLRGLPGPPLAAIEEAARWAHVQHRRARRLSLPRAMLARSLEVFVLFDRARHLESHGFAVRVGSLFPPGVSARNLALVASRFSPCEAPAPGVAIVTAQFNFRRSTR